MTVADTSVVVALMNARDDAHAEVTRWYERERDGLVTTPLALAEIDYLVQRGGGAQAAAALRHELDAGGLRVEWWPSAIYETVQVADENPALELGLTDASLVVLAERLDTSRIATLDERHFRALRPRTGEERFVLLPADDR